MLKRIPRGKPWYRVATPKACYFVDLHDTVYGPYTAKQANAARKQHGGRVVNECSVVQPTYKGRR